MTDALPLFAVIVGLSALLTGCRDEPVSVEISGRTMGTRYKVKVSTLPDDLSPTDVQFALNEVLESVDEQMSTWREDSEISRFNASTSTDWFPVSRDFAYVVDRALEVNRSTGGAFDITVGPLVRLWGFGPGGDRTRIPTQDEIEEMMQSVGADDLEVRAESPALRKSNPAIEIDVSAIAKGYAVDRIADALEALGVNSYMVEIGGEVRARGLKTDGRKWLIGIETPTAGGSGVVETVELDGQAIATSGDYRNYFEIEGERYAHIIDPRTGWPVAHELASVSVKADDCALADAMATALVVLGPGEGISFAQENEIAVLMFVRNGDLFESVATDGFNPSGTKL